jgi:hypothetical protein
MRMPLAGWLFNPKVNARFIVTKDYAGAAAAHHHGFG